jgi:hypothetical protein
MPSISFVADEDDFRTVLAYLNENPEVAFIVADGPGRWRAVQAVEQLDIDRIALWHIPSGALPLLHASHDQPDEPIQDPWHGWDELRPGYDRSHPNFGPGHPGILWLIPNPQGPGTAHGVGISQFQWIGNHYSVIGLGAAPATERFWKSLRRWIVRQTISRDSTGDSRAFPSAMARIRAVEGTPDPAPG